MNIESVKIATRLGLAADRYSVKAHAPYNMRLTQASMMYIYLLGEIARDLSGAIDAIFGPLASIAVLTQSARRQVWFAVLAKLEVEQWIAPIRDAQAARPAMSRALLKEGGVSRRTSVESLMSRFHELRGQTDDYVPTMPFG